MRQVYHLILKEFRQVFRNRIMVGIIFVMPLVQILILGNAITVDVTNVRVTISDRDRTPMSRDLVASFAHSRLFVVVGTADSDTELRRAFDEDRTSIALVIPRDFQRDVVRGRVPAVQLLVDGIDGNTAGVALGYANEIVQRFQARVVEADPKLALPLRDLHRIEAEPRFWYNPNLESRVYVVPGIVALILLIITVFLTGMGIVREKEIGTLEQLMVTPIRAWQLVLGKIIPFIILAFIEINIAIGFVYLLFGIGIEGSYLLLMAEAAIFLMTTLGLGIFISTISETQQQALFVAWFFMIFAILLSGFFIPIPNMPEAVQYLTLANPLRYFLVVLREIYLKGSGLQELLPETLSMLTFGILVLSAAILRFRRKLG
jgi:ABC-2 type transport system permease protein